MFYFVCCCFLVYCVFGFVRLWCNTFYCSFFLVFDVAMERYRISHTTNSKPFRADGVAAVSAPAVKRRFFYSVELGLGVAVEGLGRAQPSEFINDQPISTPKSQTHTLYKPLTLHLKPRSRISRSPEKTVNHQTMSRERFDRKG